MRTEIRTKMIPQSYKVYIAKDGKEFTSDSECKNYEMMLDGTRIVCPECNGKGQVAVEEEYDNYHTGAPEKTTIYPTCKKCHGKGYLEKKTITIWE